MKILNLFNYAVVGIPFFLCFIGYFSNDPKRDLLCSGLLATMVTGAYQVIVGIYLFIKDYKNRNIQIYLTSVILFFSLWYLNFLIGYKNALTFILIPTPAIIYLYFSIILYLKSKN